MSTVDSQDVDALVESLRRFSPQAIRGAIEAARDRARAEQLVGRLEASVADDPWYHFTASGLCIALGEAGVIVALPALMRLACRDDDDLGFVQDAAKYALMRMGEPAFDEAIRFIGTEPDDFERQQAYELLCAAVDADEPVRLRVTDFCAQRAPLEMQQQEEDGDYWYAAHAACEVLVFLRDSRAQALLEQGVAREGRDGHYKRLLDCLKRGKDPRKPEPNWREDWVEYCERLQQEFASSGQDPDDEPEDPNEARFAGLLNDFAGSEHAHGLPVEPQIAARMMDQLIAMATTQIDSDLSFENVGDIREALLDWLPRKVMGDVDYFSGFPPVLEAFVRFLHERGEVKDPGPLLELAAEARTELPRRAADPSYWGSAKRLFMHGGLPGGLPDVKGFDLDETVRRMAKAMDVDLDAQYRDTAPVGVEPLKPIRRESPKVGRNDPCPCGSGKKYKKCCGS